MDISNLQLIDKGIDLLKELEKSYFTVSETLSKLHIRYAPIITDEPIFELSVNFDLLDNQTTELLNPYFEDYFIGEKVNERKYYGKIVREKNLSKVSELLGLDNILTTIYRSELLDQIIDKFENILGMINTHFMDGSKVELYFGETFYPKLQDITFCYSIDRDKLYLIDYSKHLIPDIYKINNHIILEEGIKYLCVSSKDLEFYTTS